VGINSSETCYSGLPFDWQNLQKRVSKFTKWFQNLQKEFQNLQKCKKWD